MFIKRRTSKDLDAESKEGGGGASGEDKPKTPSQIRQEKVEQKAAELKKQTEIDRQALQEYHRFPTIMGWYFDGTFTKDFTLFEEYAEYFNEIEDDIEAQRDLIIEETFTEKAYRNFWPPDFVCGGKYFRTRGVYLDFKEVKEDPPKTPPNINYEKQRGVIGVEMDEEAIKNAEETKAEKTRTRITYGIPGWKNNRDNWYWSDSKRDFKSKEAEGDYIWVPDDKIWVESNPMYRTPYDWYFDDSQGKFFIKNRATLELYSYDKERNIFILKDVKGPSKNGLRKNDYFYDEKERKWVNLGKDSRNQNVKYYHAGNREVLIGNRGKSGLTPDDFYYDGESGKMEDKDQGHYGDYFYDVRDKMWKKKGQPYGPGVANHYPLDYEFNLKLGIYLPRQAKECKHVEPNDWYFDYKQGKFFMKDGHNRDNYEYDEDKNLFYLKGAEGPAANGLGPEDYYWNEDDRTWKLTVTVRDPSTMLDVHEAGKRVVMRGERGRSGKVPDDFYYDAFDGSFFRKDPKKLSMYWFDEIDMVWKKRGQYYGPGFFRLYPEHYYFDYDEGYYFPTNTGKDLLTKFRSGELKGIPDRMPYDFAFNEMEGIFQPRKKEAIHAARYNPDTGVFQMEAPRRGQEPSHKKTPKDFFYDEFSCMWLPIEHPKSHEAKYYKMAKRNNRMGPRGKTGKITDDYFFDFETGDFHEKEKDSEDYDYEYLPEDGVWIERDAPRQSHGSATRPSAYYFDREEGQFILKEKLKYGEIYLSPFTNLWIQRWRCPQDYYWDFKQQKYLRIPATKMSKLGHGHGGGEGGAGGIGGAWGAGGAGGAGGHGHTAEDTLVAAQAARNMRDYERPWLHHFMLYAADEIRYEQELTKYKASQPPPKTIEIGRRQSKIPSKMDFSHAHHLHPLVPESLDLTHKTEVKEEERTGTSPTESGLSSGQETKSKSKRKKKKKDRAEGEGEPSAPSGSDQSEPGKRKSRKDKAKSDKSLDDAKSTKSKKDKKSKSKTDVEKKDSSKSNVKKGKSEEAKVKGVGSSKSKDKKK